VLTAPGAEVSEGPVCGCVIAALAVLAPDPRTEPGRCFTCHLHDQAVLWNGRHWRWSDKPEELNQFPRSADCTPAIEMPH
jgi:hypothetical protein